MSYHHERLKLEVSRRRLLGRIEHFKVITREGNGVIHALWAFPPHKRGVRDKAVFIPQSWLSEEWQRIHGAKIVDIRRVKMGQGSRRRLSRYIVSQYCGGQSGFVRSDYTTPKWLGFSIRGTWGKAKREWLYVKAGKQGLARTGSPTSVTRSSSPRQTADSAGAGAPWTR